MDLFGALHKSSECQHCQRLRQRAAHSQMTAKTILLIEDNSSDIVLTRRALERSHVAHELVVAQDGQEALAYLLGSGEHAGRDLTALPDVTLLDLHLPRMSGLDVLRTIRADPRTRRMPVIMLTSSNEEHDVAASYDLGVNSYIQKPIDSGRFAEAIGQLVAYWLLLNEPPPRSQVMRTLPPALLTSPTVLRLGLSSGM